MFAGNYIRGHLKINQASRPREEEALLRRESFMLPSLEKAAMPWFASDHQDLPTHPESQKTSK